MRHLRPALLALCLSCANSWAHEDTPLRLAPDGSLAGLPAQYSPARLRLGFATIDGEQRLSSLTLELHGQRVDLPRCALGVINVQDAHDVQVSASWDHDEEVVPYYVQVELFDPGYDAKAWGNGGFSLLFNLRTAKLMQMEVAIAHQREQRVQTLPVDLRVACTNDELQGVMDPGSGPGH